MRKPIDRLIFALSPIKFGKNTNIFFLIFGQSEWNLTTNLVYKIIPIHNHNICSPQSQGRLIDYS